MFLYCLGEDAALAVEHGADAIMVSNHGARQLDYVPATVSNTCYYYSGTYLKFNQLMYMSDSPESGNPEV